MTPEKQSLDNSVGRKFYNTRTGYLQWAYDESTGFTCVSVPKEDAIMVGSLCESGGHAPVLDIDFPAQLIPSTTPGHFHLFLDKKLPWEKYEKLLKALYEAGIVEHGFYTLAMTRRQSMVLLPEKDRDKLTIGERAKT